MKASHPQSTSRGSTIHPNGYLIESGMLSAFISRHRCSSVIMPRRFGPRYAPADPESAPTVSAQGVLITPDVAFIAGITFSFVVVVVVTCVGYLRKLLDVKNG